MKPSTLLATLTTLATTTLAAPSLPHDTPVIFKVQLSNDLSGKNANVDIVPNTGAKTFAQLFGPAFGSPVLATSLQAVTPGATNVRCVVRNPAVYGDLYLNAWNTFVDLDGTPQAKPVDVSAFSIECSL
ncbi:hypothetical protein PTNB73_04682 [Pyrenophora teres f. teres]|nr:hypothetical protein HRS9139_04825 [Pyrenophora teres f. teres]KAE8840276.1 hypothetical protein HRS9122_06881 [Pyrenophora teres f. teres]KAE8869629.1 hypothetical protein PTNB73_04682 [Pyrenophora teres f. teres]